MPVEHSPQARVQRGLGNAVTEEEKGKDKAGQGDLKPVINKLGSEVYAGLKRKMGDEDKDTAGGSGGTKEGDIIEIDLAEGGDGEKNKRAKKDTVEMDVVDFKSKLEELSATIRKSKTSAETVRKYCNKNKCISDNIGVCSGTVVSGINRAISLIEEMEKLLIGKRVVGSSESSKETQVTPTLKGRVSNRGCEDKSTQSSPIAAERLKKNIVDSIEEERAQGQEQGRPEGEKQADGWTQVNEKRKRDQARKDKEERKRLEQEEKNRKMEREKNERLARKKVNPPPPKPEAILVRATKERTFADLFRDLKTNAGDKIGGIQTVRKSRGGDLLCYG